MLKITKGVGKSGISFTMIITRSFVRIELGILYSSKETNKRYFKRIFQNKAEIEETFGYQLEWQEWP